MLENQLEKSMKDEVDTGESHVHVRLCKGWKLEGDNSPIHASTSICVLSLQLPPETLNPKMWTSA